MVMPVCGQRGCVGHYVSDVLTRDFASFRLVLISSKSASDSKGVYSRCTRGSREIGIMRRRGGKIDTTEGDKLELTGNACVVFYSDSS